MNKANQTFSILFWINKQRSKNGRAAIYLRLTINNKRIELATHQYTSSNLCGLIDYIY